MSEETPSAQPEAAAAPVPEKPSYCTFDDFCKVKLKVAEVIKAEPHPNADKLLKLQIKVGDRTKQICAGIRAWYTPEQMVGKRIVIVDNLEPRKLRGELSEGMLLAMHDHGGEGGAERVVLITTDLPDAASGSDVG